MKLEPLHDEEMYCLVAPDGGPQLPTLAPDFPMCIAMIELMASKGIGQPFSDLLKQGFQILPVKVSIKQNGTADEGFNRAKDRNDQNMKFVERLSGGM